MSSLDAPRQPRLHRLKRQDSAFFVIGKHGAWREGGRYEEAIPGSVVIENNSEYHLPATGTGLVLKAEEALGAVFVKQVFGPFLLPKEMGQGARLNLQGLFANLGEARGRRGK